MNLAKVFFKSLMFRQSFSKNAFEAYGNQFFKFFFEKLGQILHYLLKARETELMVVYLEFEEHNSFLLPTVSAITTAKLPLLENTTILEALVKDTIHYFIQCYLPTGTMTAMIQT